MFWVGCVDGHSMSSTWLDSMTNYCTSNLVGNDCQYRPDPHGMRDPRRDLLVVESMKLERHNQFVEFKNCRFQISLSKEHKKHKTLGGYFCLSMKTAPLQ